MVRSVANVILTRVWARSSILRQELIADKENIVAELALSSKDQMIYMHIGSNLEPKLDVLLAKKKKPNLLKLEANNNVKKGTAMKVQNYKFKHQFSKSL